MGKKQEVLTKIFRHCQQRGDFVFDNELVKKICQEVNFKNPFDVTKIDRSALYPDVMKQGTGYFIIHLGEGQHQFVPNVSLAYHQLEVIDKAQSIAWKYRPSLLNEFDTSESNIISVGLNQRILHDFLYDDIEADAKQYMPRRTKITEQYTIDAREINVTNLQMEIDAVLELGNAVTIIEGKNGFHNDFAVYQLFHPYLYFDHFRRRGTLDIKEIQCCYFQRHKKRDQNSILRLHLYRFYERDLSAIELVRKREYVLVEKRATMSRLPEPYQNAVVLGDVMETLRALPDSCLNMIYGDPDYGVGINYAGRKYTQRWHEYITWYVELARECMRVLREDGNLFFINYPRQNAYLRVQCLDELAYEVFDYVWVYPTNVGHSPRRFTTAHRSVLHAVKSKNNVFYKDQVALPYKNPDDRRIRGRLAQGSRGRMPYSWFEFNLVKNVSKDKTFHACQIPIPLYDMLLKASTVEGDAVFILFGGSGSEIVHTEQAKRHFLSCEIHPAYHQMIAERLAKNGAIAEAHRIDMRERQSDAWDLPQQKPLIEGLAPQQLQLPKE